MTDFLGCINFAKAVQQAHLTQPVVANPLCPAFGITCLPNSSRFDTQSGLAPLNGTNASGSSVVVNSKLNSAWNFKSISAYRRSNSKNNIDFDTTAARITDVIATYYDKQLSQEFQFIYGHGTKLNGVLGAYYFDGEAGGLVKNIFLNRIFGTTDGKTLTKSYAVFGDGSYAVNSKLNLNAGLRLTSEKKNGIAFNAGYTNDTFTVVNAVTANYNKSKTFSSIAPKVGLDYKVSDKIMAYGSLSRGFKSGGFNVRAQSTVFPKSAEPFNDETLDVGEIGLKSTLMDGQLTLNTAVFDSKYKDIQVSTFTSYDSNGDGVPDAFFGNFLNAGNATLEGAELEFEYTVPSLSWLGFAGQVSYLDAKPDSFLDANHDGFVDTQVITNAPKYTAALRLNLNIPVHQGLITGSVEGAYRDDGFVDTQVITNAPHWTTGLHLNFDFPVMKGLLTASVGGAYRDNSVLTNEGGQYPGRPGQPLKPITQKAYTIYDAWVSWLTPDAKWRFGINGKNLTNKGYLTNGYNIPSLGILTGSYGAPRAVLATIERRFF